MSDRSHLNDALLALAAVVCAVVAASTADLGAPLTWTLVAAAVAAFAIGRGAARGDWFGAARHARSRRPAAPARLAGPAADSAVPRETERFSRPGPEVTLHEEHIQVDHRRRPRERVQLRKHVVTEYVTVTVPVRREELRLERVPFDAPHDSTVEADVTLMEEEPVVETRIVAKERVEVAKDVIAEEREITATVRREEADVSTTQETQP